ncbi:Protein of unknown function [Gryllus bimaculatus]|nr:Protein of unknown function [Gryllus bimaculatus]
MKIPGILITSETALMRLNCGNREGSVGEGRVALSAVPDGLWTVISRSQLQQEDQSRCNVAQERPIEISKTTSSLTRFPRFEPQTMKVNAVTSNPKGPNDKSLNEVTLK